MKYQLKANLKIFLAVSISIIVMCSLSACNKDAKKEREYRDLAIGFMQTEDYDAAIAYFDRALSLNDGKIKEIEIDMLKYRAEAEIKIEDYEAAAHTYSLLMENDGELDEYLNLYAVCLAKSGGDIDKAVEAYEKAEAHDPLSVAHEEALSEIGTELVTSEDKKLRNKAIDLYKQAIENEKRRSPELYSRVGKLYFEDKDIDKAKEYFELALSANKKEDGNIELEKTIKYNIAVCYEYKHEYKKALELFNEYIKRYGEDESVRHEILFLEKEVAE